MVLVHQKAGLAQFPVVQAARRARRRLAGLNITVDKRSQLTLGHGAHFLRGYDAVLK